MAAEPERLSVSLTQADSVPPDTDGETVSGYLLAPSLSWRSDRRILGTSATPAFVVRATWKPIMATMSVRGDPERRRFIGEERTMSAWRKSRRSGPDGNCVELRSAPEGFQVRDSKLGEWSPIFDLTGADFASLLRSSKA